ncbi:hypothetical protein GGH96_002683 [Coemansia sp. RSA 1972]|nr:hypothetical protein GGH96_002683 [Coemansia sp. RSA 1972]
MGKRILHVSGFGRNIRARELAHAFERYGRLVRCDIPNSRREGKPFAFVEFEDSHDAGDAFDRMHDQYVGDSRVSVQWAKRPPSRSWRFERDDRRGRGRSRSRSRSRSPYDGGRSRRRSRSFSRDRFDDRRRRDSPRGRRPDSRSRSPIRRNGSVERGRQHSRSPVRRDDSIERGRPRSLSPRDYSRSPSRSPVPRGDEDIAHGEPVPEHDAHEANGNDIDMDAPAGELGEPAHPDDDYSE